MSQVITVMHRWCQIERLTDWKCRHGRLKIYPENISILKIHVKKNSISVCASYILPPVQTNRFCSCLASSPVVSPANVTLKVNGFGTRK